MPKFPKPWPRKNRGWYLTLDGKQIPLGHDREAAFAKYHELMRRPRAQAVAPDALPALIDRFLDWVQKHRAGETYLWYQSRLQLFARRYPLLSVAELRPFHIQEWIDSFDLSSGSKRNYARAILRCLSWAEEQGLIDRNPVRHFRKPRGGRRENVISPEVYAAILTEIKRQPFRDLVVFAWEAGARAAECLAIERRHFDPPSHRIIFPVAEEKMERIPRVIYLTDAAEEILVRLSERFPSGPLFRNTDGLPWTTDAVNCAFQRVEQKVGKKYCLTDFRHSWCHRMLKSGVDALTVSVLMGHSDPTMVGRVYGHMNHAADYLLETVRRNGASVPRVLRA